IRFGNDVLLCSLRCGLAAAVVRRCDPAWLGVVAVCPRSQAGTRRIWRCPRTGEAAMTAPALELAGLRKSFGAMEIIRGVDLVVPAGERHAVIGPNGAGKSTLFHLISGHYRPSAGTVRLRGEDIAGMPPHLINRRGLSRSFQVTNIFPRLTVWENVRCATLWSLGQRYSFWRDIDAV